MAESCSVHLRANLDYEQTCVVFDGIIALYSINIILHKQPFLQRIYISQKILIFFFLKVRTVIILATFITAPTFKRF